MNREIKKIIRRLNKLCKEKNNRFEIKDPDSDGIIELAFNRWKPKEVYEFYLQSKNGLKNQKNKLENFKKQTELQLKQFDKAMDRNQETLDRLKPHYKRVKNKFEKKKKKSKSKEKK